MANTSTYKPTGTVLSPFDDSGKLKLASIAMPVFKEFKASGTVNADMLTNLSKNYNIGLFELTKYLLELVNEQADVTTNKIKSELYSLANAIVSDLSKMETTFDIDTFKTQIYDLIKQLFDSNAEEIVKKIDDLKNQFSETEDDSKKEDDKQQKLKAANDISAQLASLQSYVSSQFAILNKNVQLAIEKSLKIQSLVKPNKQKKKEQATLNKTLDRLNKFMDNFFDNLMLHIEPFVNELLKYTKKIVNKLMTYTMSWLLTNVALLGLIFVLLIKIIAKPLAEIMQPILDFVSNVVNKVLDFLTPIRDSILIPLAQFILTALKSVFENVLEPLLKGIGTVAYDLGVALGKLVVGIADFFVDVLLPFLRDKVMPILGKVLDWTFKLLELISPVIEPLGRFLAKALMDILNQIQFAWDKVVMPIIKGITTFLAIIVNIGRYIWAKLRSVLPKWMGGDGGKSLQELEDDFAGAVENATDQNLKGVNASMDPKQMTIESEIAILIRQISNGELFAKIANTVVDAIQKSPIISRLLTSITDGITKFTDTLKIFVNKIDPIIDSIVQSIEKISDAIAKAIKPLAKSIADAIEEFADTFEDIGDEIEDAIERISKSICDAIAEISGAIEDIGDEIEDAIERISKALANSIEEITEALKPILESIGKTIDQILSNVNDLITDLRKSLSDISNSVVDVMSEIKTSIADIKDAIVRSIDRITTGILELPGKIFDKIMAGIKAILNVGKMVKDAAVNAGKAVLGGAKNLWNKITGNKDEVKLTTDQMFEKIVIAFDEIKNNANQLSTLISVTLQNMISAILNSINGIVTSITELPVKLVTGITSSITDIGKGVYNTISDSISGTAKTIANWFSFDSDKLEVNPPKIDTVVLNTANVDGINTEVTLDNDTENKTSIDDVNQNIAGLYEFLKPFADATRQNFELILQKLDEKPSLMPIPLMNTDAGSTALLENY